MDIIIIIITIIVIIIIVIITITVLTRRGLNTWTLLLVKVNEA